MTERENRDDFESSMAEINSIFPTLAGKYPIRFGAGYTKEEFVQNVSNLASFRQNLGWDLEKTWRLLSPLSERIFYGATTAITRKSEEHPDRTLNSLVCPMEPAWLLQKIELDLSQEGFETIVFGTHHDYGTVTFRKITYDEEPHT